MTALTKWKGTVFLLSCLCLDISGVKSTAPVGIHRRRKGSLRRPSTHVFVLQDLLLGLLLHLWSLHQVVSIDAQVATVHGEGIHRLQPACTHTGHQMIGNHFITVLILNILNKCQSQLPHIIHKTLKRQQRCIKTPPKGRKAGVSQRVFECSSLHLNTDAVTRIKRMHTAHELHNMGCVHLCVNPDENIEFGGHRLQHRCSRRSWSKTPRAAVGRPLGSPSRGRFPWSLPVRSTPSVRDMCALEQ